MLLGVLEIELDELLGADGDGLAALRPGLNFHLHGLNGRHLELAVRGAPRGCR